MRIAGRQIPSSWLTVLLLALFLALGAVLRLARPDLVAFKLDEAKFVGIVDSAASGGWPASGAMSSWGILQPPLRAYVLAPARWLTSDVAAVPAWLGLLSLGNLVAIGLVAAQFSRAAAVGAVALAAASPWVLHFGRAVWDAPIQLFGTLALLAALRTIGNRRWAIVIIPLLVLEALTHLTAWSMMPIIGYLFLRYRHFRTRWFAAGAGLGLAMALPYVALVLSGPMVFGQGVPAREYSQLDTITRALQFGLWFISGADLQSLLGETYARTYPFSAALAVGPFVAGGLLMLGTWAALRIATMWAEEGAGGHILVAWVVTPWLATMILPGQLFLHYFQVWGGGAPFVLAGLGVAWLWKYARGTIIRGFAVGALLAIPLVQTATWWSLLGYFDQLADTSLGPTLSAWEQLTTAARDAAPNGTTIQIATDGDSPAYQDKPAVLNLLLRPEREPVFTHHDSAVLFETTPTVFITTPPHPAPGWGFEPIPGLRALFTSPAGTVWIAAAPGNLAEQPTQGFQDGLAYLGSEVRRAGAAANTLELTTFWRVTNPSERARTADLTLFIHLENGDGQGVAQDDGLDWPSDRWSEGTRIAQRSNLDLSKLQDGGWIRVGLYSRKDLQRSRRLDDGSDSILLGPIPSTGSSVVPLASAR
ncbi:MAG: hypothetical protein EXR58_04960 [Chloroflexi bacterium]|nr:hypothetical protein [Chloroflexota bacterium]